MKNKNIILIGITGVGKTTVGYLLAQKLHRKFIDLDKFIELHCGVDIPTIFAIEGENGFRQREYDALEYVLNKYSDAIISLGGGAVIQESNRLLIKQNNCEVVHLHADIEFIAKRLIKSPNTRPLLANGNVKDKIDTLYNSRRVYYEELANHYIDVTNKGPYSVIKEIRSALI